MIVINHLLPHTLWVLLPDRKIRWLRCCAVRILNGSLSLLLVLFDQFLKILGLCDAILGYGHFGRHDSKYVQWIEYECMDWLGVLCLLNWYHPSLGIYRKSLFYGSVMTTTVINVTSRPSILSSRPDGSTSQYSK